MGVTGLWQILDSVGHPIKLDGLEGKRLGVDANIWLYKFIRGFKEKDNVTSIESHKLGLFNRISKLLFYKIKPIFVFDGPAPVLKRKTLEKRHNVQTKVSKVQEIGMRLIAEQLKQHYPNLDIDSVKIRLPELRSNNLVAAEKLGEEDQELFRLPVETVDLKQEDSDDSQDIIYEDDLTSSKVDVHSKEFADLPPEIRHEILNDVKAKRRRILTHDLPDDAGSFSKLQMDRLRARRLIQEKIEQCEKEICASYTGTCDGSSAMFYVKRDTSPLSRPPIYDKEPLRRESPPVTSSEQVAPIQQEVTEPIAPDSNLQHDIVSEISDVSDAEIEHSLEQLGQQNPDTNLAVSSPKSKFELSHQSPALSDEEQSSRPSSRASSSDTMQSVNPEDSRQPDLVDLVEKASPSPESQSKTSGHSPAVSDIEQISRPSSRASSFTGTLREVREIVANNDEEHSRPPAEVIDLSPEKSLYVIEEVRAEKSHDDSDIIFENYIPPPTKADNLPTTSAASQPVISVQVQEPAEPVKRSRRSLSMSPKPLRRAPSPPIVSQPVMIERQLTAQTKPQQPSVSRKIVEEAKELLRLFGVPYIDAAGEAEAQCALLEELKLTDGTITDDSDVWLFGSQTVYRHFFSDDKFILQYKMSDIKFHLSMTRENLVCFAMLVGSDYTDGIQNVGPVAAVEVLSEFPGDNMDPLIKLKEWRERYTRDRKLCNKKRAQFLKWHLPDEFPSRSVFEGYMRPMADASTEQFKWGTPELDELREYARRNFGWDNRKIDDKLLPVMKKLNERSTQPRIDSFFFKRAVNRNPELFRSKRVNEALGKISKSKDEVLLTEDEEDDDDNDKVEKPKQQVNERKRKATKSVRKRTTRARKN